MSEIKIYQVNGNTEISVSIDKDTVWLSLNQITELFDRDKSVISRHIFFRQLVQLLEILKRINFN
jgi:hypothetical protein